MGRGLPHEEPGTVVVHHDLSALAEGIVHRRVRHGAGRARGGKHGGSDGERSEDERDVSTILEPAHGCFLHLV